MTSALRLRALSSESQFVNDATEVAIERHAADVSAVPTRRATYAAEKCLARGCSVVAYGRAFGAAGSSSPAASLAELMAQSVAALDHAGRGDELESCFRGAQLELGRRGVSGLKQELAES
jgi:hypothetical protein